MKRKGLWIIKWIRDGVEDRGGRRNRNIYYNCSLVCLYIYIICQMINTFRNITIDEI